MSPAELVETTLKYGDKGTIRRIGYLLEQEGIPSPMLRRLQKALPKPSSLIPWIPTRPKRGKGAWRWGVVVNEAA